MPRLAGVGSALVRRSVEKLAHLRRLLRLEARPVPLGRRRRLVWKRRARRGAGSPQRPWRRSPRSGAIWRPDGGRVRPAPISRWSRSRRRSSARAVDEACAVGRALLQSLATMVSRSPCRKRQSRSGVVRAARPARWRLQDGWVWVSEAASESRGGSPSASTLSSAAGERAPARRMLSGEQQDEQGAQGVDVGSDRDRPDSHLLGSGILRGEGPAGLARSTVGSLVTASTSSSSANSEVEELDRAGRRDETFEG